VDTAPAEETAKADTGRAKVGSRAKGASDPVAAARARFAELVGRELTEAEEAERAEIDPDGTTLTGEALADHFVGTEGQAQAGLPLGN